MITEALIGLASFLGGVCLTLFGVALPLSNRLTSVCTEVKAFKEEHSKDMKALRNSLDTHISSPPRECLVHNETISKLSEHDKQIAVLKERIIKNEQRE